MYIKTCAIAAAMAACCLTGNASAETQTLSVNIEAVVPSATGLQLSPVGNWTSTTQTLNWDISSQSLQPLQQQLGMKSGLGKITAHLANDAALTGGAETIDLDVIVGGKPLAVGPANSVDVASDIEAAAGKNAAVRIAPVLPGGGYKQGTYQGVVNMVFESSAP